MFGRRSNSTLFPVDSNTLRATCYGRVMSEQAARILAEALSLPPRERAEIATALLASLDDTADPDVETAWRREISRRTRELHQGTVPPVDWPDARRRIFGRR